MPTFKIHHGDCVSKMREMHDCSVDSIVTDPPYELGFMGKKWDSTGIAYSVEMWKECLRVLKPGGHLLAFSGSRTYHRMTCAIEDAGFEVRDQIMWIYGSGFPKSHNLTGDWQGWGTALKPAHEPICVARKPLIGTVAENVQTHGTGALNIDGCRVGRLSDDVSGWSQSGSKASENRAMSGANYDRLPKPDASGRWPANLIHDGSEEVLAGFPHSKDGVAGKRSGVAHVTLHGLGARDEAWGGYGSSGSAARFFYCAKASQRDRDDGLDGFELHAPDHGKGNAAGGLQVNNSKHPRANTHPTVKPTDLMRYLCRLVTPPGGVVLDPFMGSGSTGKAAMLEGFNFVGCDMNEEYVAIAKARIENAIKLDVEQDTTMDLFA